MVNRVDLFIYCDWLMDKGIDTDKLRIIVSCAGCGIIGVGQFGVDVVSGDGCGDGSGFVDEYVDGFGYGGGVGRGDGSGYGDCGSGYEDWNGGGYGCGFDLEFD